MIRLLYVDDETTLLEVGKIYLERDGSCLVDTITSAPAALALLESTTYDAIISDYQMPGMNGIEFLKIVRNSGNTSPFILFTGRGREEVVIQALNEGADFYLQKGGDPRAQYAELTHKIRQSVQQRKTDAIIRDHERREADILDFLPDATFAIDKSGFVIAWNRAIEEMTGVTAGDMLGKGDFEYAIPFYGTRRKILIDLIFESPEVIRSQYSHIIHEKDVLSAETTLPRPQGRAVTLMGKASMLYDRLGNTIGAIESIRDITPIKSREEELQALNEEIMASQEELRGQYEELVATQDDLRCHQEQLIGVASTLPGVIYQYAIHPDGSKGMNYVSSRAEEIFGFSGIPNDFFEWFTTHVDPRDREDFLTSIDEVVTSGSSWVFEGRFITPLGRTIWFEGLSRPVMHGFERVYNGVMLDITDRKHAEIAIRESEEKYRMLVETTRTGFVIIDAEGRVLDANPEYVRLTGHTTLARIIGRSVSEWTENSERLKNADAIRQCFRDGFIRNFETNYRDRSGTITPIEINATVLQSEGSLQIHTLCRDISTRRLAEEALLKKSEELHAAYEEIFATEEELRQNLDDLRTSEQALQESEGKYRTVFENTGTATVVLEENGIISLANIGFIQLSGFSRDDIEGKKRWAEFVVQEDLQRMLAQNQLRMQDAAKALSHYEFRFVTKNGDLRNIYLSIGVVPGTKKSIASLLDITDRKLAEEALRESEKKYRSVIENIQDTYYRSDRDGNLILVSPSGAVLLGYDSVDEMMGKPIADLYRYPEDRTMFLAEMDSIGSVRDYVTQLRKKDGTPVFVSTTSHYYSDEHGTVAGVEGIIRDITIYRKAEDALRESEGRYRALFLGAAEGILVVDAVTRRIIHVNPAICRMLGYGDEDIIGMSLEDIHQKEDVPQVFCGFEAITRGEKSRATNIPWQRKDGTIIYTDVTTSQVLIDGRNCIIGLLVDVTDRKQMEEALRQSNLRLRLLTGLTRHDILNHLTAIEGYQTLALETPDHDTALEYISRARETGKRIEASIGFTREYENFGLESSAWRPIFSIIESAKSEIASGEVIVENLVPPSLEVYADPIIRKVFSTLLENSIRHGKTVSQVRFSASETNRELIITCEDDGVGVSSEEKVRIFDHGYGKNTGIGLFLAKEILSITGLSIRECGVEGRGARFEILVQDGNFRQ